MGSQIRFSYTTKSWFTESLYCVASCSSRWVFFSTDAARAKHAKMNAVNASVFAISLFFDFI